MMRSKLFLALSLCLIFTLAACVGPADTPSADISEAEKPEITVSTEFSEESAENISEDISEEISEEVSEEVSVPSEPSEAEKLLAQMTLEEKVYQLFVTTPDQLTGIYGTENDGIVLKNALATHPVGGLIYFGNNISSASQIQSAIEKAQSYTKIPLLICVDEEGGRVSRLSKVGITEKYKAMQYYGSLGNPDTVTEIYRNIGTQMRLSGFNVDFAPVADIITNKKNTEIGDRSFSSDPYISAEMVAAAVKGLSDANTASCLKHFPGHGSTEADTHKGISITDRTLEDLRSAEFIPFKAGIDAGVSMVMISHMSAPNITGSNIPCDLSKVIVTDLLRNELGFEGIVITDSQSMGAIIDNYSSGEAAVMAINAGVDIVLMPYNLTKAANAVIAAVNDGSISEARIDESVERILSAKLGFAQ